MGQVQERAGLHYDRKVRDRRNDETLPSVLKMWSDIFLEF